LFIFLSLIILSAAGIGFVLWTLKNTPEEEKAIPINSPTQPLKSPDKETEEDGSQEINSLLNKFNFNFKNKKKKISLENDPLPTGTASLKTIPAEDSSIPLDQDIIKENFDQLEKLLKEKNTALENSEQALNNELKNRQEFEKIKILLETELFDTRQKAKKVQEELTSTSQESQQYKEKLVLLKEKADELEQKLTEKEKDLNELLKRLEEKQKTADLPKEKEETILFKQEPPVDPTTEKDKVAEFDLTQPLEILPQNPLAEDDQENIRPKIKEKDHKKEFFKIFDELVEIPDPNTPLGDENPYPDSEKNSEEKTEEKSELTNDDVKDVFPQDGFLKLKPDIIDDDGKVL